MRREEKKTNLTSTLIRKETTTYAKDDITVRSVYRYYYHDCQNGYFQELAHIYVESTEMASAKESWQDDRKVLYLNSDYKDRQQLKAEYELIKKDNEVRLISEYLNA